MQAPVLIHEGRFEKALALYSPILGGVTQQGAGVGIFGNGTRLVAFPDLHEPTTLAGEFPDALRVADVLFDPVQVCVFRSGTGWAPRVVVDEALRWTLYLEDRLGSCWTLSDQTLATGERLKAIRNWLSRGCGSLRRLGAVGLGYGWHPDVSSTPQIEPSASSTTVPARLGLPHFEFFDPATLNGPSELWSHIAADGTRIMVERCLHPAKVRLYVDPPDLPRALTTLGLDPADWQCELPPKAGEFELWRQDDPGNRFRILSGLSEYAAGRWRAVLEARGHKQIYWVSRSAI